MFRQALILPTIFLLGVTALSARVPDDSSSAATLEPAAAVQLEANARPESNAWLETNAPNIASLLGALAHPYWLAVLLTVAFAALCVEAHNPGMGVFGFVSLLAFSLFLCATLFGGTAGWLELTLFAFGILCVLIEIFVLPGFGLCGVVGSLAIGVGCLLAGQTFILPHDSEERGVFRQSLACLAAACCGMAAVGWVSAGALSKRCRPDSKEFERIAEAEKRVDYAGLVGRRGVAETPLIPSGKGNFDGLLIDVLSDGTAIDAGKRIVVIEAAGSRAVVREAE